MARSEPRLTSLKSIPSSRILMSAGAVVAGSISLSPAVAQDGNPYSSIESRIPPEFATEPLRVGGFEVSPRIEVDMEVIDNVFASDVIDRDDVTVSIRPAISVRDRRSDRQLSLYAKATYETYLNNSFADRVLLNAKAQAKLRLDSRTRPFFSLSFRQNDTRSSEFVDLLTTAQPVQLTSFGGSGGFDQDFGPITATIELSYSKTSFDDEIVSDAGDPSASLSDFQILSGRLRIAYSVNPSQQLYVEGQINDRNYSADETGPAVDIDPLADRTSEGFAIRAGMRLRLSDIISLDASAGYLKQRFENVAFEPISSLSFNADLLYNPSRLTQVRLSGSRSIDDTVNPFFNGLVRTELAVGVEHELLRNLFIATEGSYRIISANVTNDLRQSDAEEFEVSGRIRMLISQRLSVRVRASYFERGSLFGGSQLRGLVGLAYSF